MIKLIKKLLGLNKPEPPKAPEPPAPVQESVPSERLLKEIAQLIDRYDMLANRAADPGVVAAYTAIAADLVESLVLGGCEAINPRPGDSFCAECHRVLPFGRPEQARIARTLRMGVKSNGLVYTKAVVTIEQ